MGRMLAAGSQPLVMTRLLQALNFTGEDARGSPVAIDGWLGDASGLAARFRILGRKTRWRFCATRVGHPGQ